MRHTRNTVQLARTAPQRRSARLPTWLLAVLALLGTAAVVLPAAPAGATVVPVHAASSRTLGAVVPVAQLGRAAAVTQATPQPASPCSDRYQIGSTGYIYYSGTRIASVKQYYSPSCHRNWGYVWLWESFRARGLHYNAGVAVYNHDDGQQYGNVYSPDSKAVEFWSKPTATVSACTAGYGDLMINNMVEAEGYSSKRC